MSSIKCCFVTPEYFQDVLEFTRNNHLLEEPISQSLGLEKTVMDHYYLHSLAQGTSVMAIDTANNNRIVGVRANRIECRGDPKPVARPRERKAGDVGDNGESVCELINLAYDNYNPWEKTDVDRYVHFKFLCVDKEYRGQGISVLMHDFTFDFMRQEGIRLAYVFASSKYSSAVFKQVGFQEVDGMLFTEYKKDGKQVFSPEPPHVEWVTMIKWVE